MFSIYLVTICVMSSVLELVSVNAIHCYQCNSVDDPECRDIGSHSNRLAVGFYKECKENGGELPFCRKTVLSNIIAGNETRTLRSCGLEKYHIDQTICYRVENEDHLEISCQCFEDGCNGSNQSRVFSVAVFLSLTLFVGIL